jgi:magnesium transporter
LRRVIVDCAIYEDGRRRNGSVDIHHAYSACRQGGKFAWIGMYEPTEEEFDSLRREFDLHPLAVEDAIHAHERPKLEVFEGTVFIVLKTVRYVDSREVLEIGEILIFLGHDYILTVRHGKASALKPVRESLESDPELLKHGPGAVLHAIVDRVVDDYSPALDGLSEDIEQVENEVFSQNRTNPAERIYRLKREVLEFNHAAAPLVEPIDRLAKGHYEQVPPEVRAYFRDVNDHLIRVHEQLDGYRDLLTSILQANLAQVTVQQNDDVRRISAIVAILAVPTMLAGIYGMNFEHMPELGWSFGYPLVLAVMLTLCAVLYRFFRRAGWL